MLRVRLDAVHSPIVSGAGNLDQRQAYYPWYALVKLRLNAIFRPHVWLFENIKNVDSQKSSWIYGQMPMGSQLMSRG